MISKTTVFLVKRNDQFQLLRILPGGKDVVDSNGNEVHLVGATPSQHRWRDTIGWWWEEVVGNTMVIEGDLPDGGVILVQRRDKFKILLHVPMEGSFAVDNRGNKYLLGQSLMETGLGDPWWSGITGQVWNEVVGPPPPIEVSTPETIEMFTVEDQEYTDQHGFKRTEKIKGANSTMILETGGHMRVAINDVGHRLCESHDTPGKWWNGYTLDYWYSEYPGQLMENPREEIKLADEILIPVKHQPKTFEVFMVGGATYKDQWGFKRTEKCKTVTRTLTMQDDTDGINRAVDSDGTIYVQLGVDSPKWWTTDAQTWYTSYSAQLMKRRIRGWPIRLGRMRPPTGILR